MTQLGDLVLNHVSAWLETYSGQEVGTGHDYTQHTRAHAPTRQIILKNAPVASVASIMEGSTTLSTSDWTLDDADLGMIWFERPLGCGYDGTPSSTPVVSIRCPKTSRAVLLRQSVHRVQEDAGSIVGNWKAPWTQIPIVVSLFRKASHEQVDAYRTDDPQSRYRVI